MWELISRNRPQGHRSLEVGVPRDVRPRYVLGLLPRPRSNVFCEIPSEASWISWSCPKLSDGHRGPNVSYKLAEEGE
jgi:hypothetical protein